MYVVPYRFSTVQSLVATALEGFRSYAAGRVSRRRQKRLLTAAFSSWSRLQETEGPYRSLMRSFHHWRGAWQYRLHLQAAQVAVSRHVELRLKRRVWDAWVVQYKEEERGKILMKQAEQLRVQWGIEKGLLVLHEHRLQREWMSWCTYRAELFLEEKLKEKVTEPREPKRLLGDSRRPRGRWFSRRRRSLVCSDWLVLNLLLSDAVPDACLCFMRTSGVFHSLSEVSCSCPYHKLPVVDGTTPAGAFVCS